MKREYSDIGGIQQQAVDIIRQAYDKGYKAGYVDGKDEAYKNPVPTQDAYNDGLRDAWECARKIAIINNGISDEQLTEIFGTDDTLKIFDQFSVSEAIAKIKEYEEQQKQADDKVFGYDAYKDIRETLVDLTVKNGYTKAMIQTVLEQMEESEQDGKNT